MILVILTALIAVCGAAKLEKSYIPPISTRTAQGSHGALIAPFEGSSQGLGGLPTGSYTNDDQGVVVDAVNPGVRTSGAEPTGLGGLRTSYGSTNSKVGDAAFKVSGSGSSVGPITRIAPGFESIIGSDNSEADKTSGSKLKFATDVRLDNYSYEYETENGISAGENAVATNGVQAQGGYSYKGNDGKTYNVTYTAGKDGYKPQGNHFPTPPPIPDEILKSLEKNAKEEAAGLVDDGSYDAQKYNEEGEYSSNGAETAKPTIAEDATASGSFVSQNNQAQRPSSGVLTGTYYPTSVDSLGSYNVLGEQLTSESNKKIHQGAAHLSGSTENRFGVEATKIDTSHISGSSNLKSEAHSHGSVSEPPVRIQSLSGASAYSSAITTGSGSASAFASTGPSGFGLKNEHVSPLTFGSASQHTHDSKSDSSVDASYSAPATASASASVSGTPSFGTYSQQYSGSSSNFGSSSHSKTDHSSEAGLYKDKMSSINAIDSSMKISQISNVQGANLPAAIASSVVHSGSSLGNLPSSASAIASTSGNSEINSNSFASRFGENQPSVPSVNIVESTSEVQHSKPLVSDSSSVTSGSSSFGVSSFNSKPNQYTQTNNGISSQSGQTQFVNANTQSSGVYTTQPILNFESISSQVPTKIPDTELTTPFESSGLTHPASFFNHQASANHASETHDNIPISSPTPATSFSSSQHLKPQPFFSFDNNIASSTQQPALSQQHGIDNLYYYKQPLKPFVTPSVGPATQFSNNRQPNFPVNALSQEGSKYSNTPISSASGQYQGTSSSSYNGITQAAISPFPLDSPSTQFVSQSSQFGSKPTTSTHVGQPLSSQQSTTQFGVAGIHQTSKKPVTQFGQKPIVQSQTEFVQSSTSQTSDSSLSPTQEYQGIYQYNKPTQNLPALSTQIDSKATQISTDSRFGSQQGSSQLSSQSSGSKQTYGSTLQQAQSSQGPTFGSHSNNLVGEKPQSSQATISTSSVSQGQFVQTPHSGQKPIVSSQGSLNYNQQSQFGGSGQYSQKPQATQSSSFFSNTQSQQSQFENKPIDSTQFGSYNQQTTGIGSSLSAATQTSFGQKPFGISQTAGFEQNQFGSAGSKFGPSSQSIQGTVLTSTSGLTSSAQKPSGTAQTGSYQQGQFGSSDSKFGQGTQPFQGAVLTSASGLASSTQKPFGSTDSRFGQKPQTNPGSSFPSTSFGQSQTSQFGKKPIGTTQIVSTFPQTQFGSTDSKFGQSSQLSQSSVQTSTSGLSTSGQKPFGSSQTGPSYQQTQFGSTVSKFGQSSQPTQGTVLTSTSGLSSSDQKPFGTTQKSSTYQQFGSSSSKFGQGSQSTQGSVLTSTSGLAATTQKPFGLSQTGYYYQQGQSESTESRFGQKPQATQGSSFTSTSSAQSQTSQFGKKPVGTAQIDLTSPQTQFGLTGSKFGQSSQSTQGTVLTSNSGLASTNQKPFGSPQTGYNYQQGQSGSTESRFGQRPQTTQGSLTSTSYAQSQTSQFGKKPVGTAQIVSPFPQTQFGLTGSKFDQSSQSTQGSVLTSTSGLATTTKKPFGSSQTGSYYQQGQSGSTESRFGQKPQASQGSSFTSTSSAQSQTSQFGKKPVGTAQIVSNFPQTQFGSTGSKFSQSSQSTQGSVLTSTSGLASSTQKPFGSSQTGSYYQQGQSGSTESRFGQKPQATQDSSFTSTSFAQSQTSQFGKKPVGTAQIVSNFPQTQFGSTGSKFGQSSQSTQGSVLTSTSGLASSTQKPFGSSQTGSYYQQGQSGSTESRFGQKPQASQGSSFTSTSSAQSQTSQFGKKPVGTAQIVSTFPQTQFGSTSSKFGQSSQPTQGNVLTSNYGLASSIQEPIGFIPSGSTNQQTQFGSTDSRFGQKPPTTQGSSFTSTSFAQSQSSQFVKNPVGTTQIVSTNPQTQFGSIGSKFSQSSQSTQGAVLTSTSGLSTSGQKPFGSLQTGPSYQQTQFGPTVSKFGQSSQPTQGTVLTSTSGLSSSDQKPFGTTQTSSTYQQFGSSSSKFGQGSQSTQGNVLTSTSGLPSTTQKPFGSSQTGYNYQKGQSGSTESRFGQKPQTTQGSSFTSTSFAQSQTSQFGKKPVGTTFPQTQFVSTGSKFGQNVQSTQGALLTSTSGLSTTGQKPIGSAQTVQTSQFGVTGTSQTTGLSSSKSQVGSTTGSQYGQKPQSSQGTDLSAGIASQTQYGQTLLPGQKLSSLSGTGSSFQQTQFGSSFGSKISQDKPVQTAQFGVKPFGSSQTTQGSTSQQSQFASTASRFGQTSQSQVNIPTLTTISQTVQPTQFGQKPFGSSQVTGSSFQKTQAQFGASGLQNQTPSSTFGSYSQSSQFGTQINNKPLGSIVNPSQSSFGQFGQKVQANAFASGSDSNVAPFGSTPTEEVSKYGQTSQFSAQAQKPLVSSLSQTNYQPQYTQTSGKFESQSQFGQTAHSNVGSAQVAGQTSFGVQSQKPFGLQPTLTTYQQTQFNEGVKPFGSPQGFALQKGQSAGDQKTQPSQSSVQATSVASQSAQSSFSSSQSGDGYNYNKPQPIFDSASLFVQPTDAQNQKVQSSQTSFNSKVSTAQTPIQSSVGLTQFGVQQNKETVVSVPLSQSLGPLFSGQNFRPEGTASTVGSSVQGQTSAVSTSQSGVQTTKPADLSYFSGHQGSSFESQSVVGSTPQFSIQPTQGSVLITQKPSQSFSGETFNVFSNTQSPFLSSFPSRVGSDVSGKPEGSYLSSSQSTIVPIPGYELGSPQGFVGQEEEFGGPKQPPRFDDKTGYYY